jgi:hypothetical protein
LQLSQDSERGCIFFKIRHVGIISGRQEGFLRGFIVVAVFSRSGRPSTDNAMITRKLHQKGGPKPTSKHNHPLLMSSVLPTLSISDRENRCTHRERNTTRTRNFDLVRVRNFNLVRVRSSYSRRIKFVPLRLNFSCLTSAHRIIPRIFSLF